jgi:hypothetical protein
VVLLLASSLLLGLGLEDLGKAVAVEPIEDESFGAPKPRMEALLD